MSRSALKKMYLLLLTITMRDRVTDDDRWGSKCLSLAPGCLRLKQEMAEKTSAKGAMGHVDSQKKVTTELRGSD